MLFPDFVVAEEKVVHSPEYFKQWEASHDKLNIRNSSEMFTDTSNSFLAVPGDYPDIRNFEVAQTPPTVDFGIIQGYEPTYLPSYYYEDHKRGGLWEGYGDVTRGPDDRYYFSIGDHRSYGGNAYIFRYDPKDRTCVPVVDLKTFMGWKPDEFVDGKVHGDIDIGPGGDTWFLTYFGPGPTKQEWDTAYRGSWLFHFNIYSNELECLGIPLEGSSWPYYNYDYERNLLFGVSHEDGIVISYDTNARRMLYGGAAKHGIAWYSRCTMLDKETGVFYSSSPDPENPGVGRIVSYKRRNNEFTWLNSTLPANPAMNGKLPGFRSHTSDKDDDGAFWCFTSQGMFFRFYPAEDRTELIGPNWGKNGYYTVNMSFSPGKRYIYYVPSQTGSYKLGTPVVQYDTEKNRMKVIAFLRDFYAEKFNYHTGGPWGIEISTDGESLIFYTAGSFGEESTYRRPAMFQLHIPASERVE